MMHFKDIKRQEQPLPSKSETNNKNPSMNQNIKNKNDEKSIFY